MNAFLRDIYAERAIIADGVIEVQALDLGSRIPVDTGQLCGDAVRAHISGTDLVCDRAGHWMVLEDNLRIPSGTAYAIVNQAAARQASARVAARPPKPATSNPYRSCCWTRCGHRHRRASTASRQWGPPSAGWEDSAWFEHTFLADEMGIPLVRSSDLSVQDGKLLRHFGSETDPIDVLYARMDEDMLLCSPATTARRFGPGCSKR